METGIQEAAQVVGIIINGIERFLRLTGSFARFTGHELKQLFTFLYAKHKENLADPNKLAAGEVKLKDLFERCNKSHEKTGIMQIDERIQYDFELYAKENGLTYSYLYDANKGDGQKEIIYREGQSLAFEAFITSNNPLARAYSCDEYLENATPEAFYEAEKQISEAEKNIIAQKTEQTVAGTPTKQEISSVVIDPSQISGVSENENKVEIKLYDADNVTWNMTINRDDIKYLDNNKDKMIISIDEKIEHEVYQKSAFSADEKGNWTIKKNADRGAVYKISGHDCMAMAKNYNEKFAMKHNTNTTFVNSKTGASKTVDAVKDKAKEATKAVKGSVTNVKRR